MPNHRDMSTRNCYSFEHLVVFVLFFVQKTEKGTKNCFFSKATGLFKRRGSAENTLRSNVINWLSNVAME